MLCSPVCVLLSPRDLVPSCFHEFMLLGSPTVMPSCYRASKLWYRKESGSALLFCYLASRLTLSPALSSSQANAYAPSVTRVPFLLVQVSKIVLLSAAAAAATATATATAQQQQHNRDKQQEQRQQQQQQRRQQRQHALLLFCDLMVPITASLCLRGHARHRCRLTTAPTLAPKW